MNIHQFKPGDEITRTEPVYVKQPAEYNPSLGITLEPDPIASFNFVGQHLIFRGIANGCVNIYVVGGYGYTLPLHSDHNIDWSEGWEHYEEPLEVVIEKVEEKPKRDKNWLWIAWTMVFMVFIGLSDYVESSGPTLTTWIMIFYCGLTAAFSFYWFYFPRPNWRE